MHPFTEAHFFFIKAKVIVLLGKLNGVVLGMKCLEYDLAGCFSASGAACHLGQQLECALSGAEVREAQCKVGADHPHQCDSMNVMALGNHLRPHQEVDLAGMELVEHALKVVAV